MTCSIYSTGSAIIFFIRVLVTQWEYLLSIFFNVQEEFVTFSSRDIDFYDLAE